MNTSSFRAISRVLFALATLVLAQPSFAQQKAAPSPQQAPALSQPSIAPQPSAAPVQAPAAAVQPAPTAETDVTPAPADGVRPLKSTTVALRELSPWSMFLSADILVKAVMIGLAFASLVTWTIFIAMMIELSLVRRRLVKALRKIGDSRSLAEAQFALGSKDSILSSLLAAAM